MNQSQQAWHISHIMHSVVSPAHFCLLPQLPYTLILWQWRSWGWEGEWLNSYEELEFNAGCLCVTEKAPYIQKRVPNPTLLSSNWVTGLRSSSAACHRVIIMTCQVLLRKNSCGQRDRSLHNNICSKTTCAHTQKPPILLF